MKKNIVIMMLIFLLILLFSCKEISGRAWVNEMNNNSESSPVIDPQRFVGLAELQNKLHIIAKNETLSVVSISTEKIISQPYYDSNPFDFFFRDPWGSEPNNRSPKKREFKQTGLGSGVIYKKKGKIYYIITNYHVIRGVDSIKVTIDQERYYDGETVASDPAVDIAVIKIKTKDDLKVARFGDSDKLSSGDFVIAIGNPFGLQGTMTFGIISALGRGDISTGTVNLTNFIQTDAAINPGNSGGALINIEGEVIGINTLIYSQSGGNIGIGFAIPVNIAKKIADQIIDTGKVEHGYLGIEFEELDKDKIKTLNLGDIKGGMHVLNVLEDSPADKYGLRLGDVLIELNGKKLIKSNDLTLVIGNSKPGAKVRLKILRDGELVEKEIVLSNRDEMKFSKKSKEVEAETFENYGIELTELNKNIRGQYKISSNINGVVIVKIDPRAIASRIGLKEGDVIYNINNNEIKTVDQVKKVLKNNENENYFFINRNGKKFIVKM